MKNKLSIKPNNMSVLTINSGSSSIKFALYSIDMGFTPAGGLIMSSRSGDLLGALAKTFRRYAPAFASDCNVLE